jgi:cell division protein FtsI (penicillin-binding protein 3)
VQEGTGKALKNDVYTICGKTGTAQVADKGIKYSDGVYHGSFVGFFPKENPLYTICVAVRTRKGANNYYGGQIALPVFKAVADRLYANSIKTHKSLALDTNIQNLNVQPKGMLGSNINYIQQALNCFKTTSDNYKFYANTTDSNGKTNYVPIAVSNNIVPNVAGMGLRTAIQVLEQSGLRVVCAGKGKVASQSIAPGATIKKGTFINITLQ